MTTKDLAKVALALMLGCILVGTFSVKAFGFDADTTAYLTSLEKRIVLLEKTTMATDWKAQQKITALAGTYEAIHHDMALCPLRLSAEAKSYCKTRWVIKKKPLYQFLHGFAKK